MNVLGDDLLQDFIVVDRINENCILDGSERTIYRVKEDTASSPAIITRQRITIMPFSATVVESEGEGGKLPLNITCYLERGPGLHSGLRVDPFVCSVNDLTVISVVLINETNEPITIPKFQVIGRMEFERTEKECINFCGTEEQSSIELDFSENLPPVMAEADRASLIKFLKNKSSMFASKADELGKTGLVKHHINTEG
ncbi:hypothetical protein OUZ56_011619 [Daphnia magna]|uniref:Uncharacterized protein n=1 Tax=Daphnia magna TaxID=35525 RepID=A0ABQ9Z0N3_9CRUS|nr:hypothetical protein OUZ56_011619 [Daphnia magna]